MKLRGEGLSLDEELARRNELADRIEDNGIGVVVGSGLGRGEMDIGVELADATIGVPAIREIAEELGIADVEIDRQD
ncbi:MAG: hypothetical protein CMJ58_15110 [Planctomycetaceae bacterium]|nr:hypothetical protein [Planctomycetaceae bacterium]